MLYKTSCDSLLPTSPSASHIVLPLPPSTHATLSFFMLLKQDTLVPTLGLFNLLFTAPETLCLQIFLWLVPSYYLSFSLNVTTSQKPS